MADHHQTATTAGDFTEHQKTYDSFLRMSAIVTLWVLCIVATLAIGGTSHRWGLAGFWLIIASIASILGAAIKGLGWRPGAVVLVMMLATLLLTTH